MQQQPPPSSNQTQYQPHTEHNQGQQQPGYDYVTAQDDRQREQRNRQEQQDQDHARSVQQEGRIITASTNRMFTSPTPSHSTTNRSLTFPASIAPSPAASTMQSNQISAIEVEVQSVGRKVDLLLDMMRRANTLAQNLRVGPTVSVNEGIIVDKMENGPLLKQLLYTLFQYTMYPNGRNFVQVMIPNLSDQEFDALCSKEIVTLTLQQKVSRLGSDQRAYLKRKRTL